MRFTTNNKGFTLIEILVVLALTVIVMGLIFGPLIKTFQITRQAETIIRAQDNARMALSQVTRDLSNAMYVYDNTRDPINFPVLNSLGSPVIKQVLYAKVDLVLPKMRGYCPKNTAHTPGGIQRGEEAAPTCPVCGELLELKPVEPLIPDTVIVRYFLGLKDPTQPYYNGYNYKLAEADRQDNTYVLYRVEFKPFDRLLFPDPSQANFNNNLSDPNFFYKSDPLTDTAPNGRTFAANWRSICRPVVTLNDIDLITIEFDASGNPIVTPTVKFAPTAVYNDPLVPTSGAKEQPENGEAPPTMYKASYGHWVLPYKVMLDSDNQPGVVYETMLGLNITGEDPPTDMCIYRTKASTQSVFVFNITHYLKTKDASPYGVGEILPSQPADRELAFTVDTVKGTVNCAFPNCIETQSNPYCTQLNELQGVHGHEVFARVGGYMALSEVANSSDINDKITQGLGLGLPFQPHPTLININAPSPPRVLNNATVVPGSVRVIFARDLVQLPQPPKPAYYTKSAFLTQDPGANQFAVDIEHDKDYSGNPSPGAAAVYFHEPRSTELSGDFPFPDDPNVKEKNDVLVYYEVQNNKKGDRLRANYVTKDLMTVILGIRIYDTESGKVQAIQLTNKMRLRNIAE